MDINEGLESNKDEVYSMPSISKGPYSMFPIIEDIPKDLNITSAVAYDEHIYLGTNTGDLLHYYEIESGNLILVSKTQFNSDSPSPIDKIILLPRLERACVLSHNELVLFLLPEFAPMPNSEKIIDVNDIDLEGWNGVRDKYRLVVFKDNNLETIKVTENGFEVVKKYDHKLVKTGKVHGSTLMVSKLNSYEIIDLKKHDVIPLFRISDRNATLQPIISSFSKDAFLICSGGASYDDNAMGLVVDHKGDITQGTIVLDKFPKDIVTSPLYPSDLLVNFGDGVINIFNIRYDEEPELIQNISSNDTDLNLWFTEYEFKNYNPSNKDVDAKRDIIEKLRLVPFFLEDIQELDFQVEREKAYVEERFQQMASVLICDNKSLYGLAREPFFITIKEFDESKINIIETHLKIRENARLSNIERIEIRYLKTLLLLLDTFHCKTIGKDLFRKWASNVRESDVRILLYLLGLKFYGNFWCFNGLKELVSRFKMLNLIHKCDDSYNMIKYLKILQNSLPYNGMETTSSQIDIIKSIEMNIYEQLVSDKKIIDFDRFSPPTLDEIIKVLSEKRPDGYKKTLLAIYIKGSKIIEAINLLKEDGNPNELLEYISSHITKLDETYPQDRLFTDINFILEKFRNTTKGEKHEVIKNILSILKSLDVDVQEFLSQMLDDTVMKVLILENIGAKKKNDREFLVKYYTEKLRETIESDQLLSQLRFMVDNYVKDYNYFKISIFEHFKSKISYEENFRTLTQNMKNLVTVAGDDIALMRKISSELRQFEDRGILNILYFSYNHKTGQNISHDNILNGEERFELFKDYNDFLEIEKGITNNNFISILLRYCTIEAPYCYDLIVTYLNRNEDYLKDHTILVDTLKTIPKNMPLVLLYPVLLNVLKRVDYLETKVTLKKTIVKGNIEMYSELLNSFDREQ